VLEYLTDPAALELLSATGWIAFVIWLVLLVAKAWALVDSLRHSQARYVSAGKQSRTLWLVLTALSLAFHLITDPIELLNIAGTIASLVYLLDVRPALRQVSGRGGGSSGPYGPW
jgi:hypothetical protein